MVLENQGAHIPRLSSSDGFSNCRALEQLRMWGGRCEPGIIYGYNCKCNDNVLGATCDWNNKSDARVLTRAGITPERLNMAFYFANIVYADVKDPKKLAGVEK